ncbi:MAG: Dabb family protein [Verrucomicrobiaceae bacterium]
MEHHVYFWLKEEHRNESDRARFEEGLRALTESPNIASHHWGKPAPTEERPVTDHSWDYAISFKFESMEAHDAYQAGDEVHDAFISGFKEWWSKVLVMDLA